ncbi:MAG TPA: pyridoxal 5'-phosphate synthase glutaminase subunit PdxT [Actinocrinis sp.]|nr:pyridoxal 5'-phosphate synthase glutaminase subunit PdxT [Actinocrinis sp.]HEV3173579.1 pyridoxal 5'-phosphate synthase glutaminase subunit PdxT [Actinocrinis sp.]
MTIGVLALQGDVREHIAALESVGARAVPVRRASELDAVEALVIPGGESTAMWRLATAFDMFEPVRKRLADGMPAYGSCAGMIMLADRVLDAVAGQETFGGLDITVRRNAFGRQVDSFEEPIAFEGIDRELRAVFIRAPWVEEIGDGGPADGGVQVLARVTAGPGAGRIVAVRQGVLMATSFHPELTGDNRVHGFFADLVRAAR